MERIFYSVGLYFHGEFLEFVTEGLDYDQAVEYTILHHDREQPWFTLEIHSSEEDLEALELNSRLKEVTV